MIEKASWPEEMVYKSDIDSIQEQVSHIKGVALILFGDYLHQQAKVESHLYAKKYKEERLKK
ncbi:MAG: hypothetical protein Q9M43_05085 [Sulfurimonas sp.]|nr:hypothetical protein [Sulfurimonas sp.]